MFQTLASLLAFLMVQWEKSLGSSLVSPPLPSTSPGSTDVPGQREGPEDIRCHSIWSQECVRVCVGQWEELLSPGSSLHCLPLRSRYQAGLEAPLLVGTCSLSGLWGSTLILWHVSSPHPTWRRPCPSDAFKGGDKPLISHCPMLCPTQNPSTKIRGSLTAVSKWGQRKIQRKDFNKLSCHGWHSLDSVQWRMS